jgi:hypothetical protein
MYLAVFVKSPSYVILKHMFNSSNGDQHNAMSNQKIIRIIIIRFSYVSYIELIFYLIEICVI